MLNAKSDAPRMGMKSKSHRSFMAALLGPSSPADSDFDWDSRKSYHTVSEKS
jgi:hypothetical protein